MCRVAGRRDRDWFCGCERHVAVFVVVDVDVDRAGQFRARRVVGVDGSPTAVPEVRRRVSVRDEEDGDFVLVGIDAVGGGGVVLGCVVGQALEKRFYQVGML